MAKNLNIEELIGGLLEAGMVAQGIAERQHIQNLSKYFKEDGTPITVPFNLNGKVLDIPLYILADHSSIGLDELEIEFEARLVFGDSDTQVSDLKYILNPCSKNNKTEESDSFEKYVKSITVDGGKYNRGDKGGGLANVKVKFKSDTKPEMVSRLVDILIQGIDPSTNNSST